MTWAQLLVKFLFTLFGVLVDIKGSKACLSTERFALLEIKNFFHASEYRPLSSWLQDQTEANCCEWTRVHCDNASGRVTHLILSGLLPNEERIHKTLNFSLLLPFEQLQFLDLSNNYFKDSAGIEGLCGLKNLLELDISHNVIVSLPECIVNLTSLRVLDLSSTSMTGNVPSFITSLKSLEYLSLFDTQLEGSFSFSSLANHSKLEVFRLSSNANNLHVETESPPWLPAFQLNALQLANCTLDSIPSFLMHQHKLRLIDLSNNNLKGEFPTWLLNNNLELEILSLTNNSFTGTLQFPTFAHGLVNLALSSNSFGGQIPKMIGKVFPNMSHLNLANNIFVGSLPASMVDMQRIQTMDFCNNKLSGEIARNSFSNWTSLKFLSLSNNSFSGHVIPRLATSARLEFLLLDHNYFGGEIEDGILNKSSLLAMDLSGNMISGRIPRWIGNFSSLMLISMSKNFLEDEIPLEICNLLEIQYLDISENSLSGALPHCLVSLPALGFLHMQKNTLKGYIPSAISPTLYSLDLRDNNFFGVIPNVLHNPMISSNLGVLLLAGNQLSGSIPENLCDFSTLRIMDLSHNRLTGIIPSCLANITFAADPSHTCQTIPIGGPCVGNMDEVESIWFIPENIRPLYKSTLELNFSSLDDLYLINEKLPAEFTTKNNLYSYTGNVLELMSGLDLSSNELNGSIPPEIGYIRNILALNLSHNHLSGTIPQSFSNLVKVESLDLSYNNLSGAIPPHLTELNSLAIFNVSYNNLSGPTPTTGQFANFDQNNYKGNPGLYGPFLDRSSSRTLSPLPTSSEVPRNGGENHKAIELVSFYWGFVCSYVTAVLGLAITIWISPHCCEVWFRFVNLSIYYCFPCFRNGLN